jgi:hypothetical protein
VNRRQQLSCVHTASGAGGVAIRCTRSAVQTWLAAAEISAGPVFRAEALGSMVSDMALAEGEAIRRLAELTPLVELKNTEEHA